MAISGDVTGLEYFNYAGERVLPEKDSYSLTNPDGVVSSSLPGGLPKSAIQFFNDPYTVSVTYVAVDGYKINYIENFFKQNRGQKFIAKLAVSHFFEDFVVQVDGQPNITKTGFNGSATVTYKVEPSVDRELEQVFYDWGKNAGNAGEIWDLINQAVQALPGE